MTEAPNHTAFRILMISDTVGGVWSYSVEVSKALKPFGVHIYLVTTGAPLQESQKDEISELKNVTVYETDFLLEWMHSPWQSLDASGSWLLHLEDELQPDIIHTNAYVYGSLLWKAPVIVVAHSDVYSWWHAVKKINPPSEWNEYFNRVQQGLREADYIIAPSKWMMQQSENIYSISTLQKVIYNGRSTDTFQSAKKQSYIFSMGRIWDEAKNIQLLQSAAPKINYPIRLAGDYNFKINTTETQVSNVSYLGKLSTKKIAAQLSAASVYVLPAKYEPFGLSALEAALSGCALVLGNIESLKEIWGDNAWYVDTDNSDELAEKVNYLMEHEDVRIIYGEKAKKHALKYSSASMAENYMKVYRELYLKSKYQMQKENS